MSGSSTAARCLLLLAVGCSHAWDDYDPRRGESSGGAASSSSASTGAASSQSSGPGASGSGGAVGGSGTGAAGGDGGGGAQGGSGGITTDCALSGTNTFTDDFQDGTIAANWDIFGNVEEMGGTLVLDPGVSATEGTFAIARASGAYDLRSCSVMVQALQVPSDTDTAYAGLAVYIDDDNYTELIISGPSLHSATWVQGVLIVVASIAYQAGDHAWWRIREEGGTLFYEVSTNGVTFTSHSSVNSPYTEANLAMILPALTSGTTEPTPGPLAPTVYDNLNVPPP